MAQRLKIIDRDTPMLLPPSIQDWVGDDHPARLIVEMIYHIDLNVAVVNHKGTGDSQYPPGMMLALLIYCYSNGVFSSRKIERATYDSVGVRYICANEHPDHDTICKFRRENGALLRSAFTQTLGLAADLKLINLNQLEIASDGTIIVVSASEKQYMSQQEIDNEIQEIDDSEQSLEQQVIDLLEKAEKTDKDESKKSELPDDLKNPDKRTEKIKEAAAKQKQLARRKAKLQAAREFQKLAKKEAAEQREETREEVRNHPVGHIPKPLSPEVDPEEKINVHEPEAPKMKKKKDGYGFAFNAQASVDIGGIGLALAGHLTTDANDRNQLRACIEAIESTFHVGCVHTALADRGYDNTLLIDKLEQREVKVLCELQRSAAELKGEAPANDRRGRDKRTRERREEHLKKITTEENTTKRKRRKETIEPEFGTIKSAMGFDQFMVKGLEGAEAEWHLVLLCNNIRKLNNNQKWTDFISMN